MSRPSLSLRYVIEKTILETVHETVKVLHKANLIDAQTMCEFDEMCLIAIYKTDQNSTKFPLKNIPA